MNNGSRRTKVPGRGWAYTGTVLGGSASIAANVAHSFVPPAGASADWQPQYGAIAVSMAWPIVLFVAVEILIRVPWPRGISYHLLRWCGMLPVAIVAAFVSYRHLSGLLLHYGEERIVAFLGPLAVDGMMTIAAGALYVIHRARGLVPATTAIPPVSVPALVPPASSGVTVVQPPAPAPVAMVPVASPVTMPAAPSPVEVAQRVSANRPTRTPAREAAAPSVARPARSDRAVKATARPARPAPSATDISVTAPDAPASKLPVPPALVARVKQVADEYQKDNGTPITPGQLAVRLKVTTDQAQQALALLKLPPNRPQSATNVNGQPVKAAR